MGDDTYHARAVALRGFSCGCGGGGGLGSARGRRRAESTSTGRGRERRAAVALVGGDWDWEGGGCCSLQPRRTRLGYATETGSAPASRGSFNLKVTEGSRLGLGQQREPRERLPLPAGPANGGLRR